MTLTLRIENFDQLPDGGPTFFTVDQSGFELGRAQHLDWTLPDPDRLISGHHAEVRFENGSYFLHDVSRNGTLLNGAAARMKSPHQLTNGDRLQIGHYIIGVEITNGERAAPSASQAQPVATDNIWDLGGPAPEPVDRRSFRQEQKQASRAADFANQHLDLPAYSAPSEAAAESPFGGPAESPAEAPPRAAPLPPAATSAAAAPSGLPQPAHGLQPAAHDPALGYSAVNAEAAPPPAPAQAAPQIPRPAAAGGASDSSVDARLFFAAMAEAAGVPVETFTARSPIEVAQDIGAVLRCSTDELTSLLKARAAAKKLTKSSDRTMISASDNNPMKFIPGTAEAMEIMFAHSRPGYMGAPESFRSSFEDLKKHEYATYAAMQKALSRLLETLSPEAIEAKIKSGVIGSKRAKAWEIFVERWDAQTEPHENGMLDVFLSHFAEAYDDASRS